MASTAHTLDLDASLKLLAEPLRLRMLALLAIEELSVGELTRCLDVSQSRTSNHLRLLREGGLLSERHVGTSIYLRLAPAGKRAPTARRLFEALAVELELLAGHEADLMRLERVRALRSESNFFDRVADRWDKVAGRFERGVARERAALHLLGNGGTYADLGCGTGYMAESLLGIAERVILVDRSEPMLTEARARFEQQQRGTAVEYRVGSLDALPLADAEVDGAVCGMVLHHLPELDQPLAEMRRVLRPGGHAVVLELAPHRHDWMRDAQGDRHLGLAVADVRAAFERAGFDDIRSEPLEDHYRPACPEAGLDPSLSLYLVRGTTR